MSTTELEPTKDLAARNKTRHPGEPESYRTARQALLEREYDLRRLTEEVAEMRRALPDGAEVRGDYRFEGEQGPTTLTGLFGDHDSLIVYSYMFGPDREKPCPMCSSMMAAVAPRVASVQENTAIAFVARSPLTRLTEWRDRLGMTGLLVFSDPSGEYTRDWVSAEDADIPAFNVFRKKDGKILHFWSAEGGEADPGQDPRGAPEPDPLWMLLDMTPQGRKPDWYPSLSQLAKDV